MSKFSSNKAINIAIFINISNKVWKLLIYKQILLLLKAEMWNHALDKKI